MPATVTLGTTTLASPVDRSAGEVRVASTSGLTPGLRLFVEGEQMEVVRLLVDSWVSVRRGVDGTKGVAHPSSSTVYIGRGDQFFMSDPVGIPPGTVLVSPHINLRN